MTRIFFSIFLFVLFSTASAQDFYKDILINTENEATMKLYKERGIREVLIKSFEYNGVESEGFFCQKKISKNYLSSVLLTKSLYTSPSILTTTYNTQGRVVSSTDSSEITVNKTAYTYNADGTVQRLLSTSVSKDDDFVNTADEQHIYHYRANNTPDTLWRIKKNDTAIILFASDEAGNVTLEKNTKTGEKYYYYYNEKQQLTDIAVSNADRPKPFPLYVFAYASNGNLTQMTVTENGGSNFVIWKYGYDNGLRYGEKCYGKDRKIMGSLEYTYK